MPHDTREAASGGVTLAELHAANKARQTEWCVGGDPEPDLAFRGNELAGETGEACNVIKKLERERHGWRGSRATKDQLAEELADVIICADLCAITAGIDLAAAVVAKFNVTSQKQGLTTMIIPSPAAPLTGEGEGLSSGGAARDRIASVRLIPWEPDSQGGALITFDSGFKVAVPLYPLEGSARVTITPAALGTGEGSGGASPAGSGSQATPEAPSDLRPEGFDPSRIERAARAAWEHQGNNLDPDCSEAEETWETTSESARNLWRSIAKVMLANVDGGRNDR